jgi:hypothetical protein
MAPYHLYFIEVLVNFTTEFFGEGIFIGILTGIFKKLR